MPQSSDDPTDEAGLYVLGLLDAEERAVVADRVARQPGLRDAIEAWSNRLLPLQAAAPETPPPPAVWAAIQARLGHATGTAPRRRGEGTWLTLGAGVRMRMLHVEPVSGSRSAVLHMSEGSEVSGHDHDQVEECFVADGRIRIGDEELSAGDHLVAGAGTTHQRIVALAATTLLLHWSPAA